MFSREWDPAGGGKVLRVIKPTLSLIDYPICRWRLGGTGDWEALGEWEALENGRRWREREAANSYKMLM